MTMDVQPIGDVSDPPTLQSREDALDLGGVLRIFGTRSFVALMLIPALLVVSPASYIPMFSALCGALVTFIAGQMLSGRDYAWLPAQLERLPIAKPWMRKGLDWLWFGFDWLENMQPGRFHWLMRAPFVALPIAGCVISGLMLMVFVLVPLSSFLLALAIIWFCLGFASREGGFAIIGLVLMALASVIPLFS